VPTAGFPDAADVPAAVDVDPDVVEQAATNSAITANENAVHAVRRRSSGRLHIHQRVMAVSIEVEAKGSSGMGRHWRSQAWIASDFREAGEVDD
jgi:hypothetical protein